MRVKIGLPYHSSGVLRNDYISSELRCERIITHGEADRVHQKRDRRLQAVLALFRGAPARRVSALFDICRGDL
jgi:hypothetical protein